MKQTAMAVFAAVAFGMSAIAGNAVGGELIVAHGYRVMYGCYGCVALFAVIGAMVFVKNPPERQ